LTEDGCSKHAIDRLGCSGLEMLIPGDRSMTYLVYDRIMGLASDHPPWSMHRYMDSSVIRVMILHPSSKLHASSRLEKLLYSRLKL
jgi:hypothetical protein